MSPAAACGTGRLRTLPVLMAAAAVSASCFSGPPAAAPQPAVGPLPVAGVDHPVTAFVPGQVSHQRLPSGSVVSWSVGPPRLSVVSPAGASLATADVVDAVLPVTVAVESGPPVHVDPSQFTAFGPAGRVPPRPAGGDARDLPPLTGGTVTAGLPLQGSLTLDTTPGAVRVLWTPPNGTQVGFYLSIETH